MDDFADSIRYPARDHSPAKFISSKSNQETEMNTQRVYRWMPVLLAAVSAVGWTAAAQASDADHDIPRQVVKFADLNLDSVAGASTLYRRIESAAELVCDDPSGGRGLSAVISLNTCKAQAIGRAVDSVNSVVLTSLYLAKTGRADKPITMAGVTQ
jgi:UrcA family protein